MQLIPVAATLASLGSRAASSADVLKHLQQAVAPPSDVASAGAHPGPSVLRTVGLPESHACAARTRGSCGTGKSRRRISVHSEGHRGHGNNAGSRLPHSSVPAGSSAKGEARAHFRLAHYADSQYRTLQLQHKTRERAEELAGLKHRKQQVQTRRCLLRPSDLITACGRLPAGPRCLPPRDTRPSGLYRQLSAHHRYLNART